MTTPTLPRREPGATLAELRTTAPPGPDACHLCLNRQRCDWHWAPQHRDQYECECCFGRYARCRSQPTIRS